MTAPVQVGPPTSRPTTILSDIETTVLEGRAQGLTYMVLAGRIGCSYQSTKNVGARIIDKLGARDMAHAVFLACQAGLLDGRPRRHGDHAGFIAHQRRGEDPCWPCKQGEFDYQAERREARKLAASHSA